MQISKNRYIDALGKLFLFSAIFHVGMLVIITFYDWNSAGLNYFDILDLGFFLPRLLTMGQSQLISLVLAGVIYGAILKWGTKGK